MKIYLEKSKKNKDRMAPLRFEVGKLRVPLNIKVVCDYWEASEQKVSKRHDFAAQINASILSKKNKIVSYLILNPNTTREELINHIKEEDQVKEEVVEKETLLMHCRTFIDRQRKIKASGSVRNLKSAVDHMESLDPNLKFEDINFAFFDRYAEYLVTEGLENVTIKGYISKLKRIFTDALDKGYKLHRSFKDYEFKTGKYKTVRLTWEEVEALDKFEHFNPEYNKVKDSYIFRCNTGLRDSDYNNLTEHSFVKKNDKCFIRINSNKKEKDQLLVLNSKALEIAQKYNFNIPKFSQQHFNRIIKIVARGAKIKEKIERIRHNGKKRVVSVKEKWDMISTHTARRTFARRWYDLGGDIRLISHFLGHKNESQTREYIGLDDDDTNNEMIRVFDQGEIFR